MHSPVAYYLLLIYITMVMSPLMPQVMDVAAHTFSTENHLSTIHARIGNNHALDTMAERSAQQAHSHDQGTADLSKSQIPAHYSITGFTTIVCSSIICSSFHIVFGCAIPEVLLPVTTPPPDQHG